MRDLIKKQKIYQVEVMLEGDVFPTEKEKMDYLKEQGFPDRKAYEKALLHLEQGKKDARLDEEIKRRLGIEGGDSKNNLSLKDRLRRNSGKS